ncbi:MAG: hypothetical protein J7485_06525 [Sphingobium sp.]|nr:hypothetical protein [Sphingobium sp.]
MPVALFEEHSAMLEAAEDFLAAVRRTPRISMEELSRKRMRLGSLIRRHRTTEEEFIFGPLRRDGGFGRLPHLETVVQELMLEKVKYSEHIRKWTPQAIEQNWNGYVESCELRLRAFKQILLDEEARIYQPVLGLKNIQIPRRA